MKLNQFSLEETASHTHTVTHMNGNQTNINEYQIPQIRGETTL